MEATAYAGNKEYEATEPKHYHYLGLSRIKNQEGYVKEGKYHYYRRDHLRNNREVWQTDGNTVATLQRTQYYPSGLPWAEGEGASEQPYKYNDKEFIEMHGYDMYDSQARMYDPLIGRPTTMDPLAEKFPWHSPYVWCSNNFVNRFDPDGRQDKWGADHYGYHGVRTQRSRLLNNSQGAHVADLKSFNREDQIGVVAAFMTMATITGIGLLGDIALKGVEVANRNTPEPTEPTKINSPTENDTRTAKDPLRLDEHGNKVPDPEAVGTDHTQLGTRDSDKTGKYKQGRTFDKNGEPVRDYDFTDHNRPDKHPNPHSHNYNENPTGGTRSREKVARPLN